MKENIIPTNDGKQQVLTETATSKSMHPLDAIIILVALIGASLWGMIGAAIGATIGYLLSTYIKRLCHMHESKKE